MTRCWPKLPSTAVSWRRVAGVVTVAVLALLCGGSPPVPRLDPPSYHVGGACLSAAERARVTSFASHSGAWLTGVLLGGGSDGVVLVHAQHGSVCEWLPYARVLVGLGYRVLLFDLNGFGGSGTSPDGPARPHYDLDTAAAVGRLRAAGVDRVVVVGAEFGGLAAVVAAAEVRPSVEGVVDLSGASVVSGMDGRVAAARLRVPALFVVGRDDPWIGEVSEVYAADRFADRQLTVVPGPEHGVNLVDPAVNPGAGAVRALLVSFLRRHLPGG
jgi:pimeloyl-ACP methyl ester carboxylesterase